MREGDGRNRGSRDISTSGSRSPSHWRLKVFAALTLSLLVLTGPAVAQVTSADRACITAFNLRLRKVAKEQGKVIKKCLKDFASGRLVSTTAEDCVRSDPRGKVEAAANKAVGIINQKCAGGIPAFGASGVNNALLETVLSQLSLVHGALGADLDAALIPNGHDAGCQSKVGDTLLQCADTRIREFNKCQKKGLLAGTITDAASLTSSCLGTGNLGQPDPNQLIALKCQTKVAGAVGQRCVGTNLTQAFGGCSANDVTGVATCLRNESACQLCQLANKADNLARDCDLFDDGNGANGSCGAECGDSVIQDGETCDDGNTTPNDGCSAVCKVEGGYTCSGTPSVCTPLCGNGALDGGETCDDGNNTSGDGCSSSCFAEPGYGCTGQPSVCVHDCGNGVLGGSEACDDGDEISGNGCSASCQVEAGYNCTGQPSVCTFVCGNGTFQGIETCDDGDAVSGDGCSNVCQIESGWMCSGQPSVCTPICGDGQIRGAEACDDHNATSGDGCSFACGVEPGFQCVGQPSNCFAVCGDGFIRGFENCDDGGNISGDGCAGSVCRQEIGYKCLGQPSVCTANCGNATLDANETCDDGGHVNGDGCSSTCQSEPGYVCAGQPSTCVSTCGNGLLNIFEACDDGNTIDGDGCSSSCTNESGWICTIPGTSCTRFEVFIDSPIHGIFTTASSINVTGHYTVLPPGTASLTINGVNVVGVNQVLRTFTYSLPLSAATVFNPVFAELTYTVNGDNVRDRIVVIDGPSVADPGFSLQSVAMRINDSGLDSVEPLVGALAAGQVNLATLVPVGSVIADECFINAIGCWGSARVTIANPPPSFSNLTLEMDSKTNVVFGDVGIHNLRIDVDIDGSGLVPDCGLRLTASALHLTADYALQPKAGDPSNVDVNLASATGVAFSGFNRQFTSGLCNAPIIGDIIQALLPDIEALAVNAIKGFMADPDGAGPLDSPIAAAIQTTLEGISIAGPIGAGVGLMLETPLFDVAEDNIGITFKSDSRWTVSVGTGPGQCLPPPGTPDFTRSYSKADAFPTFGATTPVGHIPYGLGISISSGGFNQLLRGQTECGLMRTSMTTIDLDGPGGSPPLPITSTLLSLVAPEFGDLPPGTPMRIDITPTLAPIITGNAGPSGETAELKLAQVQIDVVEVSNGMVWLSGALDARLGMNFAFLPNGAGLAITISTPPAMDLKIKIVENPLGADEAQVETILPALIRPLIPQLAGAFSGFPLPQFFGLSLQGVETSRQGSFLSLFANLAAVP